VRIRGVIEGFYGPPWTHEERLDLIEFCGRQGLNMWVHAPKDDPYHRARWRDPYPDDELERFAHLVRHAGAHDVEFVWAIAPGLSIRYSDEDDFRALGAKCEQLRAAGVGSFQLLWDDLDEPVPAVEQAELSNRFGREVLGGASLVVCPTDYAGAGRTAYRETFDQLLDPAIVVYWTGPEVVSTSITREDLDEAAAAFGHDLLLWDNYPVNDFAPDRLFLGPLQGRDARLEGGALVGIVANGMQQAMPSKLALATVAAYAAEPAGYGPVAAYEVALREHGGEVAEALRRLARAATDVEPPSDVAGLVDALAPGVDAATGLALLEPFV
jgi:hyaluronoglucosaminidase